MTTLPLQQIIPPEVAEVVSANTATILAVLGLYVIGFLVVTQLAHRRFTGDIDDFVVSSRSLGMAVTAFTIFASIFSGVGMAGFPGTIYVTGVPFVTMLFIGFGLSAVLQWYLGERIWVLGERYDFNTPGDLLGTYYGSDAVRALTVVASVAFNITYIVAQLTAGGILINVLSAGAVPFNVGVLIVAVVVFFHITYSGLRGIAWLDTLNGTIIVAMLVLFALSIVGAAGGPAAVFAELGDLQAQFTTVPGPVGAFEPAAMYGTAIGLVLGVAVTSPTTFIRFYATDRRENIVRMSMLALTLFAFAHLVGTLWIGTWGRVVFPDLANPDFASPLLAIQVMPVFLAALFLIAIIAAIISTTDSYVHTMSATVTRDLIQSVFWEDMTDRQEVLTNYALVAIGILVGLAFTFGNPAVITQLAVFAGGITIQLLPMMFGALVWPRASSEAAIVSTSVGLVLTFAWELGFFGNPLAPAGLRGLFLALAINFALFFAISYVTKAQPRETLDQFHGVLREEL